MARSDLLVSLVRAGASGDSRELATTVEAIIAEERAKQHNILADRLERALRNNGRGGPNGPCGAGLGGAGKRLCARDGAAEAPRGYVPAGDLRTCVPRAHRGAATREPVALAQPRTASPGFAGGSSGWCCQLNEGRSQLNV